MDTREAKMVTPLEAERLARDAVDDFLGKCNLQSRDDAQIAAATMLAVADETVKALSSRGLQRRTLQ